MQAQLKKTYAVPESISSISQMQAQLKKTYAIPESISFISQIQAQIKSYETNFMGGILNQQKKLHELIQLTSFVSQHEKPIKTLESYRMDNVLGLRIIFENTLAFQSLAQNNSELLANIRISEDGTFSVGNESVCQEEILECINDFSINYESYIDSVNGFIEQLKNLSNPTIKAVLIYLFLPYFIAIIANLSTPYWEEQWNESANLSTREVKKEIVSSANDNFDSQFLQDHHFVASKILYVREYESTKAGMIDEIYIGKIVKVIDKKRSWSLIEYQDSDTNELKQGWVFSRYLSKFNR